MPTDVNHQTRLSSFRIGGQEVAVGIAGLVLALLILFISLLRISAMRVSAMETDQGDEVTVETAKESGQAGEVVKVGEKNEAESRVSNSEYQLAYPGILPDHKLYFVKMIRDRIWSWLVAGNEEKAEFFLLMADKRLAAAKALVEKNKPELGAITAAKAERYYQRAVEQTMKLEGPERTRMLMRLDVAGTKHTEVMGGLEQHLPITAEAAWNLAKETLRDAFNVQLKPKLDELGSQLDGVNKGQIETTKKSE